MSGKSRLHFIAGKGGVGRTTIAAALAQALADVLQGSDALLDLDEPCAAAGHVTSLHII